MRLNILKSITKQTGAEKRIRSDSHCDRHRSIPGTLRYSSVAVNLLLNRCPWSRSVYRCICVSIRSSRLIRRRLLFRVVCFSFWCFGHRLLFLRHLGNGIALGWDLWSHPEEFSNGLILGCNFSCLGLGCRWWMAQFFCRPCCDLGCYCCLRGLISLVIPKFMSLGCLRSFSPLLILRCSFPWEEAAGRLEPARSWTPAESGCWYLG